MQHVLNIQELICMLKTYPKSNGNRHEPYEQHGPALKPVH